MINVKIYNECVLLYKYKNIVFISIYVIYYICNL